MCVNHGLRHINPLIMAVIEQMARMTDRGSEENVQHIIGEIAEGITWAGFLAYTLDIVSRHDSDLYEACIALYEQSAQRRHHAMQVWSDAHPEANVRTVVVRSDTISFNGESVNG